MGNLNIEYNYNGIDINVSIPKGVSVLVGDSGLGKSLLLNSINDFWYDDPSVVLINSSLSKFSQANILELCKKGRVILLDNADLYLSQDLLKLLTERSEYIVISLKSLILLRGFEYNKFRVNYSDRKVRIEEARWR